MATITYELTLLIVQYKEIQFIVQRSDRKSFQLSVHKGYFLLKIPLHASEHQIDSFIFNNALWIENHKHLSQPQPFTFLGLQNWSFNPVDLDKFQYNIEDKTITFSENLIHPNKKTFITRIYSTYLNQWLPKQNEIALKHGIIPPNSWSVKHLSNAWGRCNSNRVINIDPTVAALPFHLQQYIVCHEIAHLIHLNHGANFWNLCDRLYPKTRKADKELNQYCKSFFL